MSIPRTTLSLVLVLILTSASISAQTGGGSTEGFKRPSNPLVRTKPKVGSEPSGGQVNQPEAAKSKDRSSAPGAAVIGIAPGAGTKGPTAVRSGQGAITNAIKTNTEPSLVSGKKPDQPKPAPAPAQPVSEASDLNEALEAAIARGNAARDETPADNREAELAYTEATQIAPADARAFEGLGHVYLAEYRNEDAAAAYAKAVTLKSQNPQVFEGLADAYYRLRKYNDSVLAATESIRLDPKPPGAYYTRALANSTMGRGKESGDDAQAFIERWHPAFAGTPPYYMTFVGYLGYWEAGRKEEANKLLAQATSSSECLDDNWICRLLKFLRHEISADHLLEEANTNDKLTEARTYIALDLALSGNREDAVPHLRWVVENGNKRFTEYLLAEAWLARISQ